MNPQLPYRTPLTPEQEAEFQRYAKLTGQQDANWSGSDYDSRGMWLASKQGLDTEGYPTSGQSQLPQSLTGREPAGQTGAGSDLMQQSGDGTIHGSDVWKTPYARTQSNESKYAAPNAPFWHNNQILQQPGVLNNSMSPGARLGEQRSGVSNIADESQFSRNLAVQKLLGSKLIPMSPAPNDPIDALQRHARGGVIQGKQPMWNHNPNQMNAAPRPMQPPMNAPGQLGRTLMGMPHHADGGVIGQSQQPGTMDRLSALWHSLFAQNQLKQAAQGTSAPPPSPPPEAQDTSMVARAAADAGRRMEAAKAAQGQPPR